MSFLTFDTLKTKDFQIDNSRQRASLYAAEVFCKRIQFSLEGVILVINFFHISRRRKIGVSPRKHTFFNGDSAEVSFYLQLVNTFCRDSRPILIVSLHLEGLLRKTQIGYLTDLPYSVHGLPYIYRKDRRIFLPQIPSLKLGCGDLSRCRLPTVISHSTLAYVCGIRTIRHRTIRHLDN